MVKKLSVNLFQIDLSKLCFLANLRTYRNQETILANAPELVLLTEKKFCRIKKVLSDLKL